MIIDGKEMAKGIYDHLKTKVNKPVLGIVVVGEDPVVASFVRIKKKYAAQLGITMIEERLSIAAETADVIASIQECVRNSNGVIVQLPLPSHINTEDVLSAIPSSHDVDGINPTTLAHTPVVLPPVAEAVSFILGTLNPTVIGVYTKAAVVGNGRLVGKPCAVMLKKRGIHVTTYSEGDALDDLVNADLVILGAGKPGLIKPHMIKEGCVLIDAGTSEDGGKMMGDADPSCAEKCSLFTPVPGGVGPIAVAMIFKNLYTLFEAQNT
ncbi:MAG: methylenetetrahydrofolate dehydrogenase / methenyltetrahydrofolate cyclohydrolase [Candidatus Kaiserbacteria bacterium]|nr:methylenetetrahydrofolate dehydrogenase / methenyltetrahydrofolate cyclohydrolase [Candidatus Kaiserbacteria bacterium]